MCLVPLAPDHSHSLRPSASSIRCSLSLVIRPSRSCEPIKQMKVISTSPPYQPQASWASGQVLPPASLALKVPEPWPGRCRGAQEHPQDCLLQALSGELGVELLLDSGSHDPPWPRKPPPPFFLQGLGEQLIFFCVIFESQS